MAQRALEEYSPIRWNVMRERYLQLMTEATGQQMEVPGSRKAVVDTTPEVVAAEGTAGQK